MERQDAVRNLGWRVTMAGLGINLALGVLYSWSVVKKAIPAEWQWSDFDKTLPYSLACLVFALTMVPAGRAQDRFGPRWVALAGGIAVGLGMILASFTTTVTGFVLGFGVLAGAGIGMGYAAATPAAVKWFPPKRTGLIAGLVVGGFGLASIYVAPLANFLINHFAVKSGENVVNTGPGVQATMLILGIAFLIVVGILSQLLAVPPVGWKPPVVGPASAAPPKPSKDFTWQQMLGTPQFYLMWISYAFAAGAGLMIIANLAPIVKLQAGAEAGKNAFLFVAILAIGNAGGRIIAGSASDVIGRRATLIIFCLLQAAMMFILPYTKAVWAFVILSLMLGANYGANLALFPAATKDYFGLKNFGVNYGWVFTAWGVGGLVLAQISGAVYDKTKSYDWAYLIAGICLIVAAGIMLMIKPPKVAEQEAAPAAPAAQASAQPAGVTR